LLVDGTTKTPTIEKLLPLLEDAAPDTLKMLPANLALRNEVKDHQRDARWTTERLCADALVAAERRIEARITDRPSDDACAVLDKLLSEMVEDRLTRFVWLPKFGIGNDSPEARRLLDRLDCLHRIELSPEVFHGVPDHRITRLPRQGERYFADGLRDLTDHRRHAILAVCVSEWRSAIADALAETHDGIEAMMLIGIAKPFSRLLK
jgi:hypothetical protein